MNNKSKMISFISTLSALMFIFSCGVGQNDSSGVGLNTLFQCYGSQCDGLDDISLGLPIPPRMEPPGNSGTFDKDLLYPPYSLSATTMSALQINLAWVNRSSADTIKILRRIQGQGYYVEIAEVEGSAASFINRTFMGSPGTNPLEPGTSYEYKLQACRGPTDCAGTSALQGSTYQQAVTVPSQVNLIEAQALSADRIVIRWSHDYDQSGMNAPLGYKIFRSGAMIRDMFAGANMFTDTEELAANTQYCYTIKAYNHRGDGATSVQRCATTEAIPMTIPPVPTNLTVTEVTSGSIKIAWDRVNYMAHYFQVYMKQGGDNDYPQNPHDNTVNDWYLDDNLIPDRLYFYKVRGCNDLGCSDFSSEISGRTSAIQFVTRSFLPLHDGYIRRENGAYDNESYFRVSNRYGYFWQTRSFLRFDVDNGNTIVSAVLHVPRDDGGWGQHLNPVHVYKCNDYLADGEFTVNDFYPEGEQSVGALDWDEVDVLGKVNSGINAFMMRVRDEGPNYATAYHYFKSMENLEDNPRLEITFVQN